MNPKVNEYIKKQSKVRQELLEHLRELILKSFPDIREGFLWGVPVYAEGKLYLASLKNQVNLGFSIIGLPKEEVALFEGSGKTTRHIKIRSLAEIDKEKLIKLMQLVITKAGVPK